MYLIAHERCRLCNKALRVVGMLGQHTLHGLFKLRDFEPPKRKIPVMISLCENCDLLQSAYSVDSDILYARYGYTSHGNQTMMDHLKEMSHEIADVHQRFSDYDYTREKPSILDIGCNSGYQLNQYPDRYDKYGIDPCNLKPEGIFFYNDSFPSKSVSMPEYDIVTQIANFYDTNDPLGTAEAISECLKADGLAVVEVSYWPEKMKKMAFDEFCHEHVLFLTFENLENIFKEAGLKVFRARKNDINGGSIQIWLKRQSYDGYENSEWADEIKKIKLEEFDWQGDRDYKIFFEKCDRLSDDCFHYLTRLKESGESIHLLGASTKGSVILQKMGIDNNLISFAAERNPEKFGGEAVGGIKMISEEESRAMKPDIYFCLIWSFKDEIIKREKEFLDRGGKIVFPLPTPFLLTKDGEFPI